MDNKMLICEDCVFVFQVFSYLRKRKYHCPCCGDDNSVDKYEAERVTKGNKNTKLRWKPEEMKLLMECIDGKKQPHQVAILTGRSINSVVKKANRVREEIYKKGFVN